MFYILSKSFFPQFPPSQDVTVINFIKTLLSIAVKNESEKDHQIV